MTVPTDSSFEAVVYHVGDFKTGTSSIQTALSGSREVLRELGINYLPSHGRVSHLDLALALRGRQIGDHEKRRAFLESLAACRERYAVVSSEVFQESIVGGSTLPSVAAGIPSYIVYYIRPHVHAFISRYLQRLKLCKPVGVPHDFLLSADKYRLFDYKLRIEAFEAAVGRENVIVRPYFPDLLPNGVVHDFLGLLSVEEYKKLDTNVRVNETAHPNAVSAMILFGRVLDQVGPRGWRDKETALTKCLQFVSSIDSERHVSWKLPPEMIEHFVARYKDDAEYLDGRLGLKGRYVDALQAAPLQSGCDVGTLITASESRMAKRAVQGLLMKSELMAPFFTSPNDAADWTD